MDHMSCPIGVPIIWNQCTRDVLLRACLCSPMWACGRCVHVCDDEHGLTDVVGAFTFVITSLALPLRGPAFFISPSPCRCARSRTANCAA